jgi:predicted metal-dependent hydrolase
VPPPPPVLPPYRYLPGRSPHPRRDPRGHAYGLPERGPAAFDPRAPGASPDYAEAVFLFNHGYYWESHEALEALWRGAGRGTPPGEFFQGLLLLAAAFLKRELGQQASARSLATRAVARLRALPDPSYGVATGALCDAALAALEQGSAAPRLEVRWG